MASEKIPDQKQAHPDKAGEKRTLAPSEVLMSPTVQAGVVTAEWGAKFAGEPDLSALIEDLRNRVERVWSGDMKSAEAMLYGQAHALNTIFTALSRRAALAEQIPQFQAAMLMALKAQAQSRATLEALAEIKNPRPVAFVKQANIANGPQQVNNGATVSQDGQQAAAMSHAPDNALPIPAGEPVGHPLPATCQAATEPATRAPGGRR